MAKSELNDHEWGNPANWPGPKWLNAYYSARDTRFWVPKRVPMLGWTINLGHPHAKTWLAIAGIVLCLLPALVVAVLRWPTVRSLPGACPWLGASVALACAAASANGLVWRKWSWMPASLAFGVFAAIAGFAIQGALNQPVVALLGGAANLTWRAHLYLALSAALAQTFGKCAFLALAWTMLHAKEFEDRVRTGLFVGLGFTLFEIMVIWSQAVWVGEPITGWWLGGAERGLSSFFHAYSTGLLAIGLAKRRFLLLAFVVLTHYATDWAAGANASLLRLSDINIETLFAVPAAATWLVFLAMVRRERREAFPGRV